LEEQLEETRQWLIDEGFELSINLALAGNVEGMVSGFLACTITSVRCSMNGLK